MSPEEEKKIMESPPVGTFALMLVLVAIFAAAWAVMFFTMFLERGPVS